MTYMPYCRGVAEDTKQNTIAPSTMWIAPQGPQRIITIAATAPVTDTV